MKKEETAVLNLLSEFLISAKQSVREEAKLRKATDKCRLMYSLRQ